MSMDGPADGLRAVVFDVDGTLADTERDGHRVAFNEAFAAAGLPYTWGEDEYGELLRISGGRRRLETDLRRRDHPPAEAAELAKAIHADKTRRFVEMVRSGRLTARPGVRELVSELREHRIRVAAATTGSRDWVEPLLDSLFPDHPFELTLTGTEVSTLKPDPAVYLEMLRRLDVPAGTVVAVEDSGNGLRAAKAAGLTCLVVPNDYTAGDDLQAADEVRASFAGDPPVTVQTLRDLLRRSGGS